MRQKKIVLWLAGFCALSIASAILAAPGTKAPKAKTPKKAARPKTPARTGPLPEVTLTVHMRVDGRYLKTWSEQGEGQTFKGEEKDEISLVMNGTLNKKMNDPDGFFTGDRAFGTYGLGAVPRREWVRVEGLGKGSKSFESTRPIICNFVDGPTLTEKRVDTGKCEFLATSLAESPSAHFDLPSRRYWILLPLIWWKPDDLKFKGEVKSVTTGCKREETTEAWETREAFTIAAEAISKWQTQSKGVRIEGNLQPDKRGGFVVSGTRVFQLDPPAIKEDKPERKSLEEKHAELKFDYKLSFSGS